MNEQQRSMVMVRIGGEEYPAVNEPKCSVCQSAQRLWIENELIAGRSYAGIMRDMDALDHQGREVPKLTTLKTHAKKHLPLETAVERRIIERRAEEMGKSVEDSEEPLIDYMSLNELIVQKAAARLQKGQIKPTAADALAASKFIRDVERQSAGDQLNSQVWSEAFSAYMEIVMSVMPRELHDELRKALHESPVLKALAEKQKQLAQSEAGLSD